MFSYDMESAFEKWRFLLRQHRASSGRRALAVPAASRQAAGRWVGGWAEGAQSVDLLLIQLLVRRGILILGLLQVGANGGEATPHVHAQRGCRPRPLPRLAWRTVPRAESSKDGKGSQTHFYLRQVNLGPDPFKTRPEGQRPF